jgi:hypothetical protein
MAHGPHQVFDTMRRAVSDYQSEWGEYRRLRNWFLALTLGGVGVFALFFAFPKMFNAFKAGFVLAGVWFILYLYAHIRLSSWRCPRCGNTCTRFTERVHYRLTCLGSRR